MRADAFDERAFFEAIDVSGARALLIGRRALVVLGLPVLTADYDFWLDPDDIVPFNEAAAAFDLRPTRSPDEARRHGRYALENDEHVDVLVARAVTAKSGDVVTHAGVWTRRREIAFAPGVHVSLPCLDDLILTKRFAQRPKDLEDIRMLETLRAGGDA